MVRTLVGTMLEQSPTRSSTCCRALRARAGDGAGGRALPGRRRLRLSAALRRASSAVDHSQSDLASRSGSDEPEGSGGYASKLACASPVVLFDLDGTVVDSGGIILASMRHATRTVLGREIPDEALMAAVGGPGARGADARASAATSTSTSSSASTARTTSRSTTSSQLCLGMDDVLLRLSEEGRRLGLVSAKRRAHRRARLRRDRDRPPASRSSSAATRRRAASRSPTRSCSRSSGWAPMRRMPPTSATRRST